MTLIATQPRNFTVETQEINETGMGLGPIATSPAGATQATTETILWSVDMTNAISLIPGASVTGAACTLTNLTTGATVSLGSMPSTSGNVVTQKIVGSTLTPYDVFRLVITFVASASAFTLSVALTLTVPF